MECIQKSVRNVRNFWVELEVDGKATKVAAGPKSKDGGFSIRVLVREDGSISAKQLNVRGSVNADGSLSLSCTMDGVNGDHCDHDDGSHTMSMNAVKR